MGGGWAGGWVGLWAHPLHAALPTAPLAEGRWRRCRCGSAAAPNPQSPPSPTLTATEPPRGALCSAPLVALPDRLQPRCFPHVGAMRPSASASGPPPPTAPHVQPGTSFHGPFPCGGTGLSRGFWFGPRSGLE